MLGPILHVSPHRQKKRTLMANFSRLNLWMAWRFERSKEHEPAAHGGPRPGCRKKATLVCRIKASGPVGHWQGHKFLSVHQHFSLPPVAYEACRCSRIRSQRHNGPEGHGGIEPRARTEQISAGLRRPLWSRPQKDRGDGPDRWAPAPFTSIASSHHPSIRGRGITHTRRCNGGVFVCACFLPVAHHHAFDSLHFDGSWRLSGNRRRWFNRSGSRHWVLGGEQRASPLGDGAAVKEVDDEQRRLTPESAECF